MAYPVSPADVEARWRPLAADEAAVAQTLLDDATALLDAARPTLAQRVADGIVPVRLVVLVLAEMVQRVLRNPDVQSSVQIGADGSVGQSFPTTLQAARPRLELTAADLAALEPAVAAGGGSTSSAIYSVPYGTL